MCLKMCIFSISILCLFNCISSKLADDEDLVQSRIYHGLVAVPGQFPYAGFLTFIKFSGRYRMKTTYCTGTIIHKNWGLTAAHCAHLNKSSPVFNVGGTSADGSDGIGYPVTRFYKHDKHFIGIEHNNETNKDIFVDNYDVALMKMSTEIIFNDKTQLIKLQWDTSKNHIGDECTFLGWGKTGPEETYSPRLLYLDSTVIDIPSCVRLTNNEWNITEGLHTCTSTAYSEKTACTGDSGGPLVSGDRQIALHVFGECGGTKPSVFASIPHVFDWIRSILMICGDADLYDDYGEKPTNIYEVYEASQDNCDRLGARTSH